MDCANHDFVWGMVTILTGFVHTVGQFYAARFLLGAAESSFLPGMMSI
jgi:MFS family permease